MIPTTTFIDLMAAVRNGFEFRVVSNGHAAWPQSVELSDYSIGLSEESLAEVVQAWRDGCVPLAEPIPIRMGRRVMCTYCGEIEWETDGETVTAVSPCPHTEGMEVSVELNIPSGRMIVANDVRPEFSVPDEFNINYSFGSVEMIKAMAEIGCAFLDVGNTCPGVYRTGPTSFTVAKPGWSEDDKEISPDGERVAGVITDLWWVSIVDGDEFDRRGCTCGGGYGEEVKVKPGVYRFTHLRHRRDWSGESDGPVVFTEIEWVRPPEEPKDYLAGYRELNLTAGQVIYDMSQRHPALYGGPLGVMLAARQMFLSIGQRDWHPNGFVVNSSKITNDAPAIEVPVFSQCFSWDPIADHTAIYRAAGLGGGELFLNESFVALARNVLECIIKHGIKLHEHSGTTVEEQRELARRCLDGLNQKYP